MSCSAACKSSSETCSSSPPVINYESLPRSPPRCPHFPHQPRCPKNGKRASLIDAPLVLHACVFSFVVKVCPSEPLVPPSSETSSTDSCLSDHDGPTRTYQIFPRQARVTPHLIWILSDPGSSINNVTHCFVKSYNTFPDIHPSRKTRYFIHTYIHHKCQLSRKDPPQTTTLATSGISIMSKQATRDCIK